MGEKTNEQEVRGVKIQNIEIPHGLFLAPLAGVSDRTFRRFSRRFGAEYTVSEMVSAKALCYEQLTKKASALSRTAPLAAVLREEAPMSVQLFGSDPKLMAEAARLLETGSYRGNVGEIPPCAIDINMGCPMAKIVSNGEGSALMKTPALAEQIVRAVVNATSLPVTVKIRAGWDRDSINAPELAKRLEDAGASMICVHGRTRQQMYAPSADWSVIGKVKDAVRIPVVGNGDIFCADDALRMMDETGCDGVMIARGAQGNPWIFSELLSRMDGLPYTPPSLDERLTVAREHAEALVAEKGELRGIAEARKHMGWYLHGMRGAAAARNRVTSANTLAEMLKILSEVREISENGSFE
ncbi:MAG: tRNA dihydrouridine synthase DusB [Clostridia bacterium]|nr:tRNA dihydrouridine synthase DusB [Clostridia bacterium]